MPGVVFREGLCERLALGIVVRVEDWLTQLDGRRARQHRGAQAVFAGGAVEQDGEAASEVLDCLQAGVGRLPGADGRRKVPGDVHTLVFGFRQHGQRGITGRSDVLDEASAVGFLLLHLHNRRRGRRGSRNRRQPDDFTSEDIARNDQYLGRVDAARSAVRVQLLGTLHEDGRTVHLANARDAVGDQQRPFSRQQIGGIEGVRMHVQIAGHHELARRIDCLRRSASVDWNICRKDLRNLSAIDNDGHAGAERAVARVHDRRID